MYREHYNTFVCMSDVTHDIEEEDPVIYNPTKWSIEFGKRMLYDKIYERFEIKLTDEQINDLFDYDENHLAEFIHILHKMIYEN